MRAGTAAAALASGKANWRQAVQRLMAERRMTWEQATREAGRRGGRKSSLLAVAVRARQARERAMRLT